MTVISKKKPKIKDEAALKQDEAALKRGKLVKSFMSTGEALKDLNIRKASIAMLESMHLDKLRFDAKEVDRVVEANGNYMETYHYDKIPYIAAGSKGKYIYLVPIEGDAKGSVLKVYDGFNYYGIGAGAGHGNEELIRIAGARMTKGAMASASFYEPSRSALSEYLFNAEYGLFREELPGYKFYMLNSGSESNDAALKLASWHQENVYGQGQRDVIVAMSNGFHGRTGYALNLNDKPYVYRGFPGIRPKVEFVNFADIGSLTDAFDKFTNRILSAHFEPIQGETGVIVPPPGYLERMRLLCDRYDVLMVADEIQTFARTGKWFRSVSKRMRPDIVTTGKIISGDLMPISVVYAKPGIGWPDHGHGNTYTGNPLACEMLMATLQHIDEKGLLENSQLVGDYLRGKLHKALVGSGKASEIRGMGAMVGIELGEHAPDSAFEYSKKSIGNGLMISPCAERTLRLLVPLSITYEEANMIVSVLEKSLA